MSTADSARAAREDLPAPTVVEEDSRDGCIVARWGKFIVGPGEEPDPVPDVWSSSRCGGEVEFGEWRLSLDVAEALALRVLAAVQRERGQR